MVLVLDGCLRHYNLGHHISQLGIIGQQLVNAKM